MQYLKLKNDILKMQKAKLLSETEEKEETCVWKRINTMSIWYGVFYIVVSMKTIHFLQNVLNIVWLPFKTLFTLIVVYMALNNKLNMLENLYSTDLNSNHMDIYKLL